MLTFNIPVNGISDSCTMPKAGKKSNTWMRCAQCPREFNALEDLQDHLRHSHPRKKYACNKCFYTADRQNDITRHIERLHAERQSLAHKSSREMSIPIPTGKKSDTWMRCPHCVHQFKALEDLEDHQYAHPPRKQHACDKCSYTANRQHEITRHTNRVHGDKQSLGHKSSLERATGSRTAVQSTNTPMPGNAEKEERQQKAQPKTSLSTGISDSCTMPKAGEKSDIWMRCAQCARQFKAVEDLEDHFQKSHPRKQYACDKCSYAANRQSDIARHMNKVHADKHSLGHQSSSERTTHSGTAVQSTITPVPGNAEKEEGQQKAQPKSSLSTGISDSCTMPKEGEKSDIWMRCPHCVHQFNSVEDLEDHLQHSHPRKKYACNKCSYAANRPNEITRHTNRVHVDKQSLGHKSSSDRTTRSGKAEKEEGQQKAQPKTSLSTDDTENNEGSNQDDFSFGGLSAPPEILARGLRAQQAYDEAAKDGTKKVFRTRLMLVGQERVGKTSLKKTLTGQGFDENEPITEGVETTSAREICIEVAKAGEKMWSIHKKGHGNEEDEYQKALADEIAKRLIVTPPQDQESFEPHSRGLNPEEAEDENRKTCVDEIEKRRNTTSSQDQESLDLHSRSLSPVEAEEFVLDNEEESDSMPNDIASLVEKNIKEQVHLKEIGTDSTDSSREQFSLSIWDFAGHDMYYTTHQVFLTWRAIYVIVFDLSKSLLSVVPPESRDESYGMAKGGAKSELTCLEFINFWLCSIFAHAVVPSSARSKNTSTTAKESPPIFIVGTHRESVKGDAKEKKKKIASAFKKIRESIMKRPFECQVVPKYYAIENSLEDKDEELVELRKHIDKVAMEEPYMGEEIPLRWLKFEEILAADKTNYMTLDQTKKRTQQIGMESEHELLTMLTFYHDLGKVVYYGGIEDQHPLLRDTVILNPQWLIDVFKQVITILDPGKMKRGVRDAWTTLEKDGILEDKLIQHMWRGFLGQKETLVQLMAKFDLICEAPVKQLQQEQQDGVDTEVSSKTKKVVKKRYYVPSRLTSHCPREISQIKSSTDFLVDFMGFLPDGLFHRLMTRAVRWIGERDGEPVNLFYRLISLVVDEEHHAFLEMLPPPEAIIKVTVFQRELADSDDDDDDDGDIHQPPAPSAVKEVMDFVRSTLGSLKQHWAKRIRYNVCFRCRKCGEKKLFQDCFKRTSLKCRLHKRICTAKVKSKFGLSGMESWNESPVKRRRSCLSEEGAESGNESPVKRRKSRITEASLGNTNSTSPRPSTSASTVVDTPPQGAAAAVGKVSTSKARKVSDAMLDKLARQIPSDYYGTFCEKLRITHNRARTILEGNCNNYAKATRDCMAIWMNKSTRIVADLHRVLRAAELGGLIVHCNKHC